MLEPSNRLHSSPGSSVIPLWKIVALLLLCGVTGFGFFAVQSINRTGKSGVSMRPPALVGSFSGEPQEVSESEKVILPSDTQFAKMLYKNLRGDQINFQIVLAGAEKRSIHRPQVCLKAQGWTIDESEVIPVKLGNGGTLRAMQLSISRPVEVRPGEFQTLHSIYLYWFVGDGVTTPDHWKRILLTSWDRVVHRRNHRWAYIIVSASSLKGFASQGMDLVETQEMLRRFVGDIAPEVVTKWKDSLPEGAGSSAAEAKP